MSEQLQLQQAAVLDKTKPKGAAKCKKVGNGWILYMKRRSLEKDLGENFETLEAFLKYSKDNGAEKKRKRHKCSKVSLPKKGKGVGLKEFLKEMSEEYKALDKEMKTEYNDAAKKLALSEIDMGASPEIEKEIHMQLQLGVKGPPRNAIKAEYNYNAAAKKLASLGVNQSGDLDTVQDWMSINQIESLAETVYPEIG